MRTNHIMLEIHFAKIISLVNKNKFLHKKNQNNQYLQCKVQDIHGKNFSVNIPVAARSAII